MSAPLTSAQLNKLRHIAKVAETRNPGDLSTTNSLVVRGLVEARKTGTFPRAFMTYAVTDKGREVLAHEETLPPLLLALRRVEMGGWLND